MKILNKEVKLISSPDVPLGHIAVPYRLLQQLQVEVGQLVPFDTGNMKRFFIGWANGDDDRKATALAGDQWVCLNRETPILLFDYDINDVPLVVPQPPAFSGQSEDTREARAYIEEILGADLAKDIDVEVIKPTSLSTTARVYYKVWVGAVGGGAKKTIHEAAFDALLDLRKSLSNTVERVDATRDKIYDAI